MLDDLLVFITSQIVTARAIAEVISATPAVNIIWIVIGMMALVISYLTARELVPAFVRN